MTDGTIDIDQAIIKPKKELTNQCLTKIGFAKMDVFQMTNQEAQNKTKQKYLHELTMK